MINYFADTTYTDSINPGTIGTTKMAVYITTDNLMASGTVSVPLAGWSQNYTVMPNSTTEIIIPTSIVICTESDSIENKGVHVTSDIPVSVYQLNYVPYTSDAAIIIPTLSLGTEYRVMTYSATDGDFETSELLVVAAYDNTVIKITPKGATVGPGGTQGHPPNIPFTITLNKGEVYQVQGNWMSPHDLTGTLIELDTTVSSNCKKFAVFSGNECARVPDGNFCCCNTLDEEMMPIKTWGTQYITIPLKTRTGDKFRITASQNGTMVTWDNSLPIGLNAGDYYEYSSGTATYVQSNKPISVAQFSKSGSADGVTNSDPFLIMLQPLDQSLGKIVFNAFASVVINQYYLNVVTRTAYTGLLTLDGSIVLPAAFAPVPFNTAYSYARLNLTQGNHSLKSDSGYTANIYGYGHCSSFGYIAGSTFIDPEIGYYVITPIDSFKYNNFTDSICKGTPLTFSAFSNPLITDQYWNFGDGSSVIHGQTVSHTYNIAGDYPITYYYQRNSICGLDSIVWDIHIKCCRQSPGINAITPVCIGTNSTITDTSVFNPDATYTWDFDGGIVVSGSGLGPYQVNWSATGKDTVWVFVSEPTCKSDSAYFVISVSPIPTSTFTLNSPLCVKKNSTINYTGNGSSSATYQWNFNGGNLLSGNGMGPYIVNWSNAGTFNVTLIVSDSGCSSSPTFIPVTVYPLPIPDFTPNPQTAFIDEPLITFDDQSLNTTIWSWNFGEPSSGTDNYSSLQSPIHSYSSEGEYTVWLIVTSSDGCIDSISSEVHVTDYYSFYVPNTFTPNGDGKNDFFQPYGTDITEYELYIFNRWGEQIFKSEPKNQPWDGKFNGNTVETGVYAWLLLYTSKKGAEQMALGRVTVLR
jgi:gliding motility-associated-like protein